MREYAVFTSESVSEGHPDKWPTKLATLFWMQS
ncbi:hypothetical protein DKE39_010535 [Acinetobacter baumannii]|nr:hypothetical protein DKE39_010535 [Acinetobacter baumannii]